MAEINYLKFAHTLGIRFRYQSGNQHVADCPFCGHDEHFYYNEENGMWDCKSAHCVWFSIGGNPFSLMRAVHACSLDLTLDEDYAQLSEERGLPKGILKRERLARLRFPFLTLDREVWLIPICNHEGNICNLLRYTPGQKCKSLPTPATLHLLGAEALADPTNAAKPRLLMAGPWDRLAALHCLLTNKEASRYVVLGVPGEGVFKDTWYQHFSLTDVWACYDNDDGGSKGIERVRKVLSKRSKKYSMPKSLSRLVWPQGAPNGFDVRDLFIAEKNNPSAVEFCQEQYGSFATSPEAKVIRFIENSRDNVPLDAGSQSEAMAQFHREEVEPLPCDSFEELCGHFAEHLFWTQNLQDVLLALLTTNLSTRIVDNPLWLYVLGPPASGKTTLIECVAAETQHSYSTSRMTGVHSGFKEEKGDQNDYGMVPRMLDKMLLIKDGTLLLTMNSIARQGILGELRDLYDGSSVADYRNNKHVQYDATNFTIGIGITPEIRRFARTETALGERFLMVEIWDSGTTQHVLRSIRNTIESFKFNLESIHQRSQAEIEDEMIIRPGHYGKMLELKRYTTGFIRFLHDTAIFRPMPEVPAWYEHRVAALATVVAISRTLVTRDRNSGDDPVIMPTAESPMRVASQLAKMGLSSALLLNKRAIDLEVYRPLVRYAHDSAWGWPFQILRLIADANHPLTVEELMLSLALSDKTVRRRLSDLFLLGAIRKRAVRADENDSNEREATGYSLTEAFKDVWTRAFHGFDLDDMRDLIRIPSQSNGAPVRQKHPVPITLES